MHHIPNPYERFEAWLLENGAYFEQLELREYDGEGLAAQESCVQSGSTVADSVMDTFGEEKKESTTYVSAVTDGRNNISEMRGVYCKSTILPNTTCLAVPRKCLITVEMGQETDIGRQMLNADLDLDAPKHVYLMIYILQDRLNPNSFFKPYYDILPKTFSNMPAFWREEELQFLQGSYLLTQIAERIEAIEEDYRTICTVCPQLRAIASLEDFKWARMCVCSRNFGLQIDGNRTSAMVPHADMLNHYRPRETKWAFDDEKQAFTITSLQTIQAGSQIFDSYGQKCNHRFLLNYGFAVEHNIELDGYCPNEVPLELRLLSSDVLHDRKFEFWCRDEAPYIKRIRVSVSNNESTKMLFSMLRVVVANEQEFDLISPSTSGNTMARGSAPLSPNSSAGCMLYRSCRDIRFPLSLRNETAALTHLRSMVRDALSRYPTTLAQDRIRLLDVCALPPFSNARHAAIQVHGEKEVLQYYDDLTAAALGVIDLPNEEEFDAAIKCLEGAGTHYLILRYCADIIGATRRRSQKQLRIPVRSGNTKPLSLTNEQNKTGSPDISKINGRGEFGG